MSFVSAGPETRVPPKFWGDLEEMLRKLAAPVRQALDGKLNSGFVVTLEAGQTQTDVRFLPAKPESAVIVTPRNASAAALARTTDVFGEADTEKVRICHDPSADGTEKFSLVVIG